MNTMMGIHSINLNDLVKGGDKILIGDKWETVLFICATPYSCYIALVNYEGGGISADLDAVFVVELVGRDKTDGEIVGAYREKLNKERDQMLKLLDEKLSTLNCEKGPNGSLLRRIFSKSFY